MSLLCHVCSLKIQECVSVPRKKHEELSLGMV